MLQVLEKLLKAVFKTQAELQIHVYSFKNTYKIWLMYYKMYRKSCWQFVDHKMIHPVLEGWFKN